MNKKILYVSMASWEERFYLGAKLMLEKHNISHVLIFYTQGKREWTKENRIALYGIIPRNPKTSFEEIEIDRDEVTLFWNTVNITISKYKQNDWDQIILDISTMPREIIWCILYHFRNLHQIITYVYHRPESYNESWLTSEPKQPKLLIKHSGIFKMDKPTALFIATGYDIDRTFQLYFKFEPIKMMLFFQGGNQFRNQIDNIEKHRDRIHQISLNNASAVIIDFYSKNHGFNAMATQIKKHKTSSNIVLSSLGPKLSALSIYKLWEKYPEIALAYTPSLNYNRLYSQGLGQTITAPLNSIINDINKQD
jgi:hypothetical protein